MTHSIRLAVVCAQVRTCRVDVSCPPGGFSMCSDHHTTQHHGAIVTSIGTSAGRLGDHDSLVYMSNCVWWYVAWKPKYASEALSLQAISLLRSRVPTAPQRILRRCSHH